jgi:hypothetical protein
MGMWTPSRASAAAAFLALGLAITGCGTTADRRKPRRPISLKILVPNSGSGRPGSPDQRGRP